MESSVTAATFCEVIEKLVFEPSECAHIYLVEPSLTLASVVK